MTEAPATQTDPTAVVERYFEAFRAYGEWAPPTCTILISPFGVLVVAPPDDDLADYWLCHRMRLWLAYEDARDALLLYVDEHGEVETPNGIFTVGSFSNLFYRGHQGDHRWN